jgi:hypothetical protein
LLYLRDEEEKRRFKEEELRESERAVFARLQAVAGPGPDSLKQAAAPPPPRPSHQQPSRCAEIVFEELSLLCSPVQSGFAAEHDDDMMQAPPAKRELEKEAASNAKRLKPDEASEEDDGAGLAGLLGDKKPQFVCNPHC